MPERPAEPLAWMREFVDALWLIVDSDPTKEDVIELLTRYAPVSSVPPAQLERLRDFIWDVQEWAAKFPLQGEANQPDKDAALTIYACCEGAEENLYELRGLVSPVPESAVYRLTRVLIDKGVGLDVMQDAFEEVRQCTLKAMEPQVGDGLPAPSVPESAIEQLWADICREAYDRFITPPPPVEKGKP
jgi:hypothetical protein